MREPGAGRSPCWCSRLLRCQRTRIRVRTQFRSYLLTKSRDHSWSRLDSPPMLGHRFPKMTRVSKKMLRILPLDKLNDVKKVYADIADDEQAMQFCIRSLKTPITDR